MGKTNAYPISPARLSKELKMPPISPNPFPENPCDSEGSFGGITRPIGRVVPLFGAKKEDGMNDLLKEDLLLAQEDARSGASAVSVMIFMALVTISFCLGYCVSKWV